MGTSRPPAGHLVRKCKLNGGEAWPNEWALRLLTGNRSVDHARHQYLLDLLWDREEPIVVTGAMRRPGLPGADGPANLVASVVVAASPLAGKLGCVVVFNETTVC